MIEKSQPPLKGMSAVLLAAGYGSRLKPLTNTTPKCLVQINGVPLLKIWLDKLNNAGVERVIVNSHYLNDHVQYFLDAYENRSIVDLIYEPELLGSVGTVLANQKKIEGNFFLAHADNISIFNFHKFVDKFNERSEDQFGVMMTFESDNPSACGIVKVGGDGVLQEYAEKPIKPASSLANAAVFIFDKRIIDFIASIPNAYDICRDILPRLIGKIITYKNDVYHRDIGTIDALAKASEYFKFKRF